MLLESIKLQNFRQFRNEAINFAKGEDGKNVTIIIGENGTGKTTFARKRIILGWLSLASQSLYNY